MAGIDKTYVHTFAEYEMIRDWAIDKEFTLSNGDVVKAKWFLYEYGEDFESWCNEHVNEPNWNFPVWNTPQYFDMWLYKNCPIPQIQERLIEQYGGTKEKLEESYQESISYKRPKASHKFKIVQYPNFKYKGKVWSDVTKRYHKQSWMVEVYEPNDGLRDFWPLEYNEDHDAWYYGGEHLPWTSSCCDMYDFNIKKLARKIKKWKLSKGCKITVRGRFVGQDYVIFIK